VAFHAPAVETLPDGRVRIDVWVDEQKAFFRLPRPCRPSSVTFAEDGGKVVFDERR